MQRHAPTPDHPLRNLQLGDILTLDTGQAYSVRSVERDLAAVVGTMTGFVLAGELGPQAVLLAVPPNAADPIDVYAPLDYIPLHARSATAVCEGVASYWAPHLPNLSGAQGEIGYKIARIRGSVDPMVLVWRGEERVVFLRSAALPLDYLHVHYLPRDASITEVDQARFAATVHASSRAVGEPAIPLPRERSDAGRRRRFW